MYLEAWVGVSLVGGGAVLVVVVFVVVRLSVVRPVVTQHLRGDVGQQAPVLVEDRRRRPRLGRAARANTRRLVAYSSTAGFSWWKAWRPASLWVIRWEM